MPKLMFTSLLAPHTKVTEQQLATEEGILSLGENLRALNRRRFLSSVAAAGALATISGAFSGTTAEAQTATTPAITDVLNFALNFEFLEAQFYVAAANTPATTALLTTTLTGGTGTISNLPQVTLTDTNQEAIANGLALDEINHITLLRENITTLGGTPITQPSIDFSAGGTIPPITTNTAFFAAARQFTALGNSAYAGAAADLVSNTTVLTLASQILGAEAQHLGVVNYICALLGILPPTDKQIDAQDVPPTGTANLFTVTPIGAVPYATGAAAPAVGIARTPSQVLGVAYGVSTSATVNPTAGVASGGFFPSGVNGNIKST